MTLQGVRNVVDVEIVVPGLAAASAAIVFTMAGGSAALADQIFADGDGAIPLINGNPATVVACTDQAVEFGVLIAARRNGSPNNNNNNVFASGSAVNVSAGNASAGMTATLADSVITLPTDCRVRTPTI